MKTWKRTRFVWRILVVGLMLTVFSGGIAQLQEDAPCPLPPRLTVGQQARVLPGLPNRIRVRPSVNGTQLNEIPSGGVFTLLEGPICADGYYWWSVDYKGNTGWTAEGEDLTYWLVPVTSERPPITLENADKVTSVGVLGHGYASDIEWSVDGTSLLMRSESGLWQFDANNLSAPPKWIERAKGRVQQFDQFTTTSPDGKLRATASTKPPPRDNHIYLFDNVTGKQILTLEGHQGDDNVWTMRFSPNSDLLASGACRKRAENRACIEGEIRVWDTRTGEIRSTLLGHTDDVTELVFSPDSSLLISKSYRERMVWDLNTYTSLGGLIHLNSIAFSPDGRLLAYSVDKEIHLMDIATRTELKVLKDFENPILLMAFSPDGRVLASSNVGYLDNWTRTHATVRLWDVKSGSQLSSLEHGDAPPWIIFSPTGSIVVTLSWEWIDSHNSDISRMRLWDTSGTLLGTISNAYWRPAFEVAFNPDETRMAALHVDGAIRIYDTRTGVELAAREGYGGTIDILAFSPDSTMVTTNERVWDISTGLQLFPFPDSWGVAFSPDGHTIAISEESVIELRDTKTGDIKASIKGDVGGYPYSLVFSPDGRTIATGTDFNIKLWDITTESKIGEFQGRIFDLAFSPDGGFLAVTGFDGMTWVLDLDDGISILEIEGDGVGLPSVAFSTDGKLLALGGQSYDNDHVKLWNMQEGKLERILEVEGSDGASDLAFSPDGRILATAGNRALRLWDVETGKLLSTVPGYIGTIAFSPDGTTIVAGSGRCIGCTDESFQLEAIQVYGVPIEE